MELQLIMDTGPETLSGAMWLNSNSSPSFQQVTSSHQNVCEGITAQSMGYHGPSNELWQEKRNMVKNSPESESQIRSNNASPHNNSTSIVLNQTKNLLKRTAEDSLQQIEEIDRKHARTEGSVGSNGSGQGWTTQVEELAEHLAADFDNSLSALAASDLATAVASYNMSEALLALPSLTVFKQEALSPENQPNNPNLNHVSQRSVNVAPTNNGNVGLLDPDSNNNGQNAPSLHQLLYNSNEEYPPTSSSTNHVSSSQQGYESNEDCRFQYVLAAATSIATKVNEETLTYLNQGQSYEIKLKKLGDLSAYRGKILKGDPTFLFQSTIRICFHERRLQYTEREQILAWQRARPGERLLEVDVPLSYGMVDVCQPSPTNNSVDFMWDPTKEVGVYVKINCISTEFTPKKHGGEKGVPFRIQVETRFPDGSRLHGASCQVKVFKLKGADRKHKQDRDKILKRPPHEQDKYQPSYDCTVLSDIPLESLSSSTSITQNAASPYAPSEAISPQSRTTISGNSSPISTPLSLSVGNTGVLPIITASESVKEDPIPAAALPSPAAIISEQPDTNIVSYPLDLSPDANASQTSAWLRGARFQNFESTFANFSASDILRLSRDDLIQICGLADGIRLYNALHSKAPAPKLSLYFSIEGNNSLWRVVYLESLTSASLTSKLVKTLNLPQERLHSMLLLGPQGIHILVTNELVANMKDENMYFVETIKDVNSDRYKLLLKPSSC
ncbi:transcription factor CP2-like protein 1 isoform X2 [Leptopilina boulardi]|uniref:transcription factor CP2-like protein 1 isoform X2 n=1 Tax=Leptopilina boulardi TaxID=63433 RepID=UPI0021F5C18E|nr:transcription factor CP2-like protein 1 isoform X2 [Leptopilina boulardi]